MSEERHPQAQRLFATRRLLRKISRRLDHAAALPAGAVVEMRTLTEDCAIETSTIRAKLEQVRGL